MPPADLNRRPYPPADAAGHLPLAVLRQYAAGTLTPAGQHRVEAHTLDCARCADILAGLSLTDAPTTDRTVAQLRQRLHARVAADTAPVTPATWPWARLAAVLLLLILSTVAFFWLRPTRPLNSTAVPIATAPAPTPAAPDLAAVAPKAPSRIAVPGAGVALRPPRLLRRLPSPAVAARAQRPQPARQPLVMAAALPVPAPALPDSAAGVVVAGAASAAVPDSLPAPAPRRVAVARARRAAPSGAAALVATGVPTSQQVVRGLVTEQRSGQPLPGVTVVVPGTNRATSTAADGSFALAVPVGTTRLMFSSVGFLPQEKSVAADSTALLTLALAPDHQSLSEVVLVPREKAPAPVSVAPLPTGGYRAWNQYLRDSLQYPEKALEDRKEGTVRLRFTVTATGQVQHAEVVRSVSPEIDEEALRLLREGPAWHAGVQNGRRTTQTVKVDIPFRLER